MILTRNKISYMIIKFIIHFIFDRWQYMSVIMYAYVNIITDVYRLCIFQNTKKFLLPFIAFRRNYFEANTSICRPGSSVDIVTGYGLDDLGI